MYINEVGNFNHVYNISTNKIATVFGRSGFYRYIQNEVRKGNFEKIKNRSNSSSEWTAPIAADYVKNASEDIIRTNEAESQDKNSQRNTLSEAALLNDEMEAREKERMAADVKRLNSLNRFVQNAFRNGKIKESTLQSAASVIMKSAGIHRGKAETQWRHT